MLSLQFCVPCSTALFDLLMPLYSSVTDNSSWQIGAHFWLPQSSLCSSVPGPLKRRENGLCYGDFEEKSVYATIA